MFCPGATMPTAAKYPDLIDKIAGLQNEN